jgi:polysaccharide pyruvyl transferase WcaK-like protein
MSSERARSGASALVLPPADPGSLGDEAMLLPLIDRLLELGFTPVVVTYGTERSWSSHPRFAGDARIRHLHAGGAQGRLRFGRELLRAARVDCLGADILDGRYEVHSSLRRLQVLAVAARLGKQATALGFSFSEHPAPQVVARFRRLPASVRLLLRDPASSHRFETATGRPATLVADVAFLLEPQSSPVTSAADHFIAEQHSQGRHVLGVNVNALNTATGDGGDLVALYGAALAPVAARDDVAVLLLPHDHRQERNRSTDAHLAERLHADLQRRLGDELTGRCHLLRGLTTAPAVKALVGHCDAIVTGRMHLAIASMSQAVPAVSLAYLGKFEGLYQHLGLSGLLVDPRDPPETMRGVIEDVLARRAHLAAELRGRLPGIRQLAASNV